MRNHVLVAALLHAPLGLLAGCSGSSPSGPDVVPAAGGESAPVVASAEPSLVPPGATLDLRVFGSGFDDGSRVDVATGGEPSPKVRTDSTRFVSEGEVVATITTAPDVPFGGYDIILTDSKGKQGIGTELIDVDSTSGIQVNTSTTSTGGADQPSGGYDILIDGVPSGGRRVSPTGSATVTGLSEGEHSVGLDGVPAHCAVSGDNPRTVSVPEGAIVQVGFDIMCTPPPPPSPPPATGDVLAFQAVSRGRFDIYWMTPDGLGPVNLTNSRGDDTAPDWSPDGSQIAFVRDDALGNSEIYVMRNDGSDVRQLTTDGARGNNFPRWSPDGSMIAFERDDTFGGSVIYVMRADGSGVRRLTERVAVNPRWSPDGSKIAFAYQQPWDYGGYDLYVMNSDGTGTTGLTTESEAGGGLAWSPDGSRIVYDGGGISIVNSDGSGRVSLTFEYSFDSFGPVWSPDGSKIAFTRRTTWGAFPFRTDVFVMDVNGADVTRLTTYAGRAGGPVWSPDGSRIVVSLSSGGAPSIAIMNSDGTGLRTLVTGGFGPTWRPSPP